MTSRQIHSSSSRLGLWAVLCGLQLLLFACGAPQHRLQPEVVFWQDGIAVGIAPPDSFIILKFNPELHAKHSSGRLSLEVSPQSYAQFQDDHSAVAMEMRGKKLISSEELEVNGLQATNVLIEEMDEGYGEVRYEKLAFQVGLGTAIMTAFYDVDNDDTLASKLHQSLMTVRRIPERDKAPLEGFTFGFTPEQAPGLKLTRALGEEMLVYGAADNEACADAALELIMRKWPKPSGPIDTINYELDWIFGYLQSETHNEDGFQTATWNGVPVHTIFGRSIQSNNIRDVRQTIWFAPENTYLWFSKIRLSRDSCTSMLRQLVPQMQVK